MEKSACCKPDDIAWIILKRIRNVIRFMTGTCTDRFGSFLLTIAKIIITPFNKTDNPLVNQRLLRWASI